MGLSYLLAINTFSTAGVFVYCIFYSVDEYKKLSLILNTESHYFWQNTLVSSRGMINKRRIVYHARIVIVTVIYGTTPANA